MEQEGAPRDALSAPCALRRYRLCDLKVGQKESFTVRIGQEQLDAFRELSGDLNPLHCDCAYARAHGFPQEVAYGMLTASFLSTLAGVYLPGERALIHEVLLKFTSPVFPGDMLTVMGEVLEVQESVARVLLKVTVLAQAMVGWVSNILKIKEKYCAGR